ncbi:MAG: alpha/beta hydrolase [Hamadaea sp.]|nr:alpha/beta hydrolase [Hamadaea sp.]NUT07552.1 alpha/beta hydrolase [Hamadaea sp.]
MIEFDVPVTGGRLHAYDTGGDGVPVVWHHGTPNLGAPPEPLFAAAERLGLRWVSYDRPGYGGSTPAPGRDFASAARYTAAVADHLGLGRFAVFGHSGGGPHALACAALLPDRVFAAVSVSGLAPINAEGLDWFAGMASGSEATLRASAAGRTALASHLAAEGETDIGFADVDWAALEGEWGWFGKVVGPAIAAGPAAQIDDDLANAGAWGFDPAAITVPVLLMHGDRDRMVPSTHSAWLAERIPGAQYRHWADEGHVSVLRHAEEALEWLAKSA